MSFLYNYKRLFRKVELNHRILNKDRYINIKDTEKECRKQTGAISPSEKTQKAIF